MLFLLLVVEFLEMAKFQNSKAEIFFSFFFLSEDQTFSFF